MLYECPLSVNTDQTGFGIGWSLLSVPLAVEPVSLPDSPVVLAAVTVPKTTKGFFQPGPYRFSEGPFFVLLVSLTLNDACRIPLRCKIDVRSVSDVHVDRKENR